MDYEGNYETTERDLSPPAQIVEIAGREVTAVAITITVGGATVRVVGEAKKHPKDRSDRDIGLLLAYSRAFEELAQRLGEGARELVATADLFYQVNRLNNREMVRSNLRRANLTTTHGQGETA